MILMLKIAISEVQSPKIRGFQRYWNERCRDAFAPSWGDIHLDDLDPKTIPFIVISDVKRAPLDFLIRFWGTEHVNRKGVDKTGKSIKDTPRFRGQTAWDEYVWVVEHKKPLVSKDVVNLNDFGVLAPFEQTLVRFPLSDDGVEVHHIISVADWASRR